MVYLKLPDETTEDKQTNLKSYVRPVSDIIFNE